MGLISAHVDSAVEAVKSDGSLSQVDNKNAAFIAAFFYDE